MNTDIHVVNVKKLNVMKIENKNWFVLYTRSRCEKKVAGILCKRNYEIYCPLNRTYKQWADRKKWVHEPLFPSYVFIKASEVEINDIKRIASEIVNVVYWLGKPAKIKNEEIEEIKNYLNEYTNVRVDRNYVNINDTVKIIRGPLMNTEGKVTHINNNVVKLLLPNLGFILSADISISNVKIINIGIKGDNINKERIYEKDNKALNKVFTVN